MNDIRLAEAIHAHGIGEYSDKVYSGRVPLKIPGDDFWYAPHQFVRDWRVAGALMKMMQHVSWFKRADGMYHVSCRTIAMGKLQTVANDSLPRAICQACVEALK